MLTKQVLTSLLAVGLASATFGCATTPTTQTAVAPTAQSSDRQVLAVENRQTVDQFKQMRAQLPQQIAVADADRLLVTIDPSQVKADSSRSVQQWGRFGFRGGWRGFGWRGFGLGAFNRFRFFNYGNYYYPYALYGGYYRPYLYSSCYNPFLYGYGGGYYPYTYGGGCGLGGYGYGW